MEGRRDGGRGESFLAGVPAAGGRLASTSLALPPMRWPAEPLSVPPSLSLSLSLCLSLSISLSLSLSLTLAHSFATALVRSSLLPRDPRDPRDPVESPYSRDLQPPRPPYTPLPVPRLPSSLPTPALSFSHHFSRTSFFPLMSRLLLSHSTFLFLTPLLTSRPSRPLLQLESSPTRTLSLLLSLSSLTLTPSSAPPPFQTPAQARPHAPPRVPSGPRPPVARPHPCARGGRRRPCPTRGCAPHARWPRAYAAPRGRPRACGGGGGGRRWWRWTWGSTGGPTSCWTRSSPSPASQHSCGASQQPRPLSRPPFPYTRP